MTSFAKRLKAVLANFKITNSMLAKGLSVDPSLVSRWTNGQRKIKSDSEMLNRLADYILSRSISSADIEWLKDQFEKDGLGADLFSMSEIKRYLIAWFLSARVEAVQLGQSRAKAAQGFASLPEEREEDAAPMSRIYREDYDVKIGFMDIALYTETLLSTLPIGSTVQIHLSNEGVRTIANDSMSACLIKQAENRDLQIRLLVSLAGNTFAVSRLISQYMQLIVTAKMEIFVVHGMAQALAHHMCILLPGQCAVMITETPDTAAQPVATLIKDRLFLRELEKSFERSLRFSQPIMTRYNDNYSRSILEILYLEFAMQGNLAIVKDSMNPMFMTRGVYDEMLRHFGNKGDKFAWRSAEFARFKSGMDENLRTSVFREILPLSRLKSVVNAGVCPMPALYFMGTGKIEVPAPGCVSILEGYIKYLEEAPNFNLHITGDESIFRRDSCWHIKENHHIALHTWEQDEPALIYSDQLMLTHEFQNYFESLWDRNYYSAGAKKQTTDTLRRIIAELKARHLR